MILSRLSDYLRRNRRASVADMAIGLEVAPDALRGMLAVLERKGRVRRVALCGTCQARCCRCSPDLLESYEWTADADVPGTAQ